jgi:hypothetical protein
MSASKTDGHVRSNTPKPPTISSNISLCATILTILAGYFAYPSNSNLFNSAIFLSYPLPPTAGSYITQYGKGPKDLIFVTFYTLVLFAIRNFVREHVARFVARSWGVQDLTKQEKNHSAILASSVLCLYRCVWTPCHEEDTIMVFQYAGIV